jgi:hypothetical protein
MSSANNRLLSTLTLLTAVFVGSMLFAMSEPGFAAETQAKQTAKQTAKPKPFTSPEQAMEELAAAIKARDRASLTAMLGSQGEAILNSGDPIEDKAAGERFLAAYGESHKVEPRGIAKAWIVVGKDDWPLPIPLVKRGTAWYFDARAGKEELLNRRIGRNELFTMQAMLAYVDAQQEYYVRNPENDKLLKYAQKFASSPGKRDGLYFPTKAGEKPSPLGPLFDAARAAGYIGDDGRKPGPYHGYRYRILKAQGPNAPGGAYDYVVNGKMIGGFGLVAYPATYGNSGVMTLMVNHDGVVYEKNLGPNTAEIAQKITRFSPDSTGARE